MITALDRATELERALRERNDSIRAAGYQPQVEHLADLTLVFSQGGDDEKRRIPIREAARYAHSDPANLSPNVLLRPLVERFIMPSACYMAGPGELAYFAQVSAVAEALDLERPLPLPRWSATILEPRIERVLARLDISREELRNREAVETRLARASVPARVAESLHALRHDLETDLEKLARADSDKLVPAASLEGMRHWMEHRLARLERRYAAAIKRREAQMMQDVATAAGALYPNGKPQERMLNFIPFWARYGGPLIDMMEHAAQEHAQRLIGAVTSQAAGIEMPERV